jgi:hypothetical protein
LDKSIGLMLLAAALAGTGPGCGGGSAATEIPAGPPRWSESEPWDVARRPAVHYAGLRADAINETLFIPITDALWLRDPGEASDLNSLDEVPDSSWFQNRLGRRALSREELLRGPCTEPSLQDDPGPWEITTAKDEGRTPGIFIRTRDGRRYLLKLEEPFRPERSSAADAIASRIHHAVGYHVPCNDVVHFEDNRLQVTEKSTYTDPIGGKHRFKERKLKRILSTVYRLPDGRLRGLASRIIPGEPIGPFAWEGRRKDDPNDRIGHEDRRELRAYRILAGWLGHFDVRGENSLDVWLSEGGQHRVRHYLIDFGDSFGSPFIDERKSRRMNHAYWFDAGQILGDTFTLGLVGRPWYHSKVQPGLEALAYYAVRDFVPERWKPIQPNRAFTRMTVRDAQWMARILARFTDDDLRALVKLGRFSQPEVAEALARVLMGRRDRIMAAYLRGHVPLSMPWLTPAGTTAEAGATASAGDAAGTPASGERRLCVEDLAVAQGLLRPDEVRYRWRELRPSARRGAPPVLVGEGWYGLLGDRAVACWPAPPARPASVVELAVFQKQRPAGAMTVVVGQDGNGAALLGVQRRDHALRVSR